MAVNLVWYEPLAVKQDRIAKSDPWYPNRFGTAVKVGFGAAVGWAVFDAVSRALGGSGAVHYWSGMLFLAVVGGAFYGLIRPWVASYLESPVGIARTGLFRNSVFPPSGLRAEHWPWEKIGELVVERSMLGSEPFRLLVAYDPQGKVLATFGMAPDVTFERIAFAVTQFCSTVRVVDRT